MNELTPFPSRLVKAAMVMLRALSWVVLALLLVLALAWGTLHGWIVPRIGDFRPRLEMLASQALGVPVQIGTLRARSAGLVPAIEARDVVLHDAQGRPALRLARVQAALSLASLWRLGLDQLVVDDPELEIRRTTDGRLLVAGLDVGASSTGDNRLADWFLAQREVIIQRGTVRWSDERIAAAPLALGEVALVLRNGARRHELRLDATPPPTWGDRFTVLGQFRRPWLSRHPGRWSDWSGQFHADFARLAIAPWRPYAPPGVQASTGHGALRLWADVQRGQFVGGAADLALTDVNVTLGTRLQPLALRSVSGRVGGKRLPGGFEFYTEGLRFDTADGLRWPGGNLFVSLTEAVGRLPAVGELRADRLDLAALSQIADRLPLDKALHEGLRAHPAKGLVETVQARWQGPWGALQKYQARGRVSGLTIAAAPAPVKPGTPTPDLGVPGLRNATLDIDLDQAGGRAQLAIADGAVELPGVFEEPLLPLDRLSAEAKWQLQGERIVVQQASLKLANADAEGEFRGSWQTSDPARSSSRSRFPGVIDLQGSFSRANGARVHRYLPLGLPEDVRHYVRDAVQQGTATGVAVRVKGDLHDIPYLNPKQGEFRFAGKVQDVTLAYVPRRLQGAGDKPWPALTALGGELVFDRNSMRVSGATARAEGLPGLRFSKVEASIPDLSHNTTVQVSAEASGPAAEMLGVVSGSPLGPLLGGALDQARAAGDASLRLQLQLPVLALSQSRVKGSVTLAGNDLRITPESPALSRARGTVSFTEHGFTVSGGQAQALGGEMRLEGGSRPLPPNSAEAPILLRIQGEATAQGLRQASELGFVTRLAERATGSAAYSVQLGFRGGQAELSVSSNLQGLALDLPAPLAKSAETALPLKVETRSLSDPARAAPPVRLEQLQVELGRLAAIVYVRDLSGPQARVVRGSIGIGLAADETLALPVSGVTANIQLDQFNLDTWQAVFAQAAGAPAATRPAPAAEATTLGYLPTSVAVRARTLTLEGHTLHDVVVGGSRDGLLWRANLDARELDGYLEYRQPAGTAAGGVFARLARLTIPPAATGEVESLLAEAPTTLPALDIVVEDFELRGKKLGRVEVEAVNRAAARDGNGDREWRLNKLNLITPEARLAGSGYWTVDTGGGTRAPGRTLMNFRLDVIDAGALLTRLGMKEVLLRGRGQLEGLISWSGSPLALHYPTMSGQLHLEVENGQFLQADPGLAKLLGVLSLQSLPRRLTLDFRDVFSEGFAFDFIRGDATIAQGIASTNNLQMKGVNAAVLMEGRADIAKETQDLRVVVVPEIDAGTASLVASVINPAVGLGTFLAQMFLRRPLAQASTQTFQIDGTWADPRITKVSARATTGAPR